MAVNWDQVEDMGDPQEQRKILIETRHKLQTLVSQEVWEELYEMAMGQIRAKHSQADELPYGLDSMMLREMLRAEARGIEFFVRVPLAAIEDLTDSINKLTAIIEGEDNDSEN